MFILFCKSRAIFLRSHSPPPTERAMAVRLSFYGQAIPPSTNAPTVAYIRYVCFECLSPDGLRRCMTRESECCVHDVRFAVLLFNGHMISSAIDMPENICIHFIMFDAHNDPHTIICMQILNYLTFFFYKFLLQ